MWTTKLRLSWTNWEETINWSRFNWEEISPMSRRSKSIWSWNWRSVSYDTLPRNITRTIAAMKELIWENVRGVVTGGPREWEKSQCLIDRSTGIRIVLHRWFEIERKYGRFPHVYYEQHLIAHAGYPVRQREKYRALIRELSLPLNNRGNAMGDTGVRVLTRILRINRHLRTVYYDRNLLSLSNFEEIVDAMEE